MSTPEGKFKSLNDSIISWFGFKISIILLCTLISNCSLAFLCMKLDLFTVYLRISVGSGTGPKTSAPYLFAISIICRAELSIILWSYALSFIRSFNFVSWTSGNFFAVPEAPLDPSSFFTVLFLATRKSLLGIVVFLVAGMISIIMSEGGVKIHFHFDRAINYMDVNHLYFIIFVTTPAPTVLPPSLIANLPFSSKATGTINLTFKLAVSPGMTISVPAGKVTSPVISDVLI